MRKVELRMNEKEKYEVIKELVDHNGNKNRAAKKLGISRRQIDRLIIKYKEKGKSAFVHGNRNKKPISTLDKSISEDIILLYKNKYQDWNFQHFKDLLEQEENIKVSYNFIYTTLVKAGYISPKARRKTKRNAAKARLLEEKKINLAMSNEQIDAIINHEVALEDSHPRGEKPKFFGEIIELDGSIHPWFGDKKTCLHLYLDMVFLEDKNKCFLENSQKNLNIIRKYVLALLKRYKTQTKLSMNIIRLNISMVFKNEIDKILKESLS